MSANQTPCRRCLRLNDGDPWYCPQCGKETTLTPHDGGVPGDQVPPVSIACSRPGCGKPKADHDHGVFCP